MHILLIELKAFALYNLQQSFCVLLSTAHLAECHLLSARKRLFIAAPCLKPVDEQFYCGFAITAANKK